MVAGRVVAGVGIGFISSTTPVWQSELAQPSWRGTLVMLQGSCIVLGVAASYWLKCVLACLACAADLVLLSHSLGLYLVTATSWQWRVPVVLQSASTRASDGPPLSQWQSSRPS
jgi:MFS family permease